MTAAPSLPSPADRGQENDDPRLDVAMLSSPLSTPLTTSPEPVSFQSLADQNSTPLSMMDDSCILDADSKTNMSGGDKPDQLPAGLAGSPAKDSDPGNHQSQRTADLSGTATVSSAGDGHADETRAAGDIVDSPTGATDSDPVSCARRGQNPTRDEEPLRRPLNQDCDTNSGSLLQEQSKRKSQQNLISPTTFNTTDSAAQNSSAPSSDTAPALRGPHNGQQQHQGDHAQNQLQYETAPAATGSAPAQAQAPTLPAPGIAPASGHCSGSRDATQDMANAAPASTLPPILSALSTGTLSKSPSPGHRLGHQEGHHNGHSSHDTAARDNGSSPSYTSSPSPLRTGSVQPTTKLVQPRPKTIVRTTSDSESLDIKHPTPDITATARSGAYVGNIAQLEATAVRLSMTSSIDDAIRDLHTELKRSDSRRSSILAASLKASGSVDDYTTPGSAVEQFKRHPSIASSIVSTNNAARHGGYSPAGYVLSPNHSLTGRLRSGSKNSAGRPDFDLDSVLSRHGPGKASVRSARSAKISLAEISESEPIALTQDVLDMADKSPPLKNVESDSLLPDELRDANVPATDVFHKMMGDDDFLDPQANPSPPDASTDLPNQESRNPQRPGSAHSDRSDTTFQQCQDAFGDFDGVHWVPDQEDPYAPPEEPEPQPPKRQMPPAAMARPQSYIDPESGQQMLFYPARVPAMLNLPPKLSNKPKAAERNKRRSQVISAMFEGTRQSRVLDSKAPGHDPTRDSWLPDPLAGQRDSFSLDQLQGGPSQEPQQTIRSIHSDRDEPPAPQPETAPEPDSEPLRRPQRLSRMDPDKRKSRMSNLPPQLRASAYFDMPPTNQPEIEVKDGSAMATLESILDASAHAPVSAFTDHERAGKLGNEVYGKEKKRSSVAASAVLRPESGSGKHVRKRSSFMWLGKRHSHASDEDDRRATRSDAGLGPVNADTRAGEGEALARSVDGRSVDGDSDRRLDDDEQMAAKEEAEDVSDDDAYYGPPTTLLAELQLRKQQQKQRTQRTFPGGMHATLLEMDAVAETQRKARKDKRVNLAWEDAEGNLVNEESDDEDVPLAILAARNQGAQNVMDLNRPIGLMERREMEDNEPLSQRRARLHGQDPRSLAINNKPSMNNLSANNLSASPLPQTPRSAQAPSAEPDDEFEGETLADRKRRLAAKDDADNPLPKARPVSGAFSVELLNQFADPEEEKKKKEEEAEKSKPAGEETLGQRRRRLQAEREAREREMSFNQLSAAGEGPAGGAIPGIRGPMHQMADVLSAHPKRELNSLAMEERARVERENRLAREREAKMAALRSQMPQTLGGPNNTAHNGGFRGGTFNDGTGGQGPQAAMSSPALHSQMYGQPALNHRASAVFSSYGAPMQQGPYGGSTANLGAMNNRGPYGGMNAMNPYGGNAMSIYGAGMMQPGMQMPVNGGSMNRIEQWRQGVLP